MGDVPASVAKYLDAVGVTRHAVAWNTLVPLVWETADVHVEFRVPRDADLAGITGSFCAIVKTGIRAIAHW